jgi:hypothetical protein
MFIIGILILAAVGFYLSKNNKSASNSGNSDSQTGKTLRSL